MGHWKKNRSLMYFVEPSHWLRHAATTQPMLEGIERVDVAIIGAGFTGLSTAIALRKRGYSVSVLEKDLIGSGASGRNCGQIGAEIGANLAALIKSLGNERAQQAANVLRQAISELDRRIDEFRLDCAYEATGNAFIAVDSSQSKQVEAVARAAERLGFPVEAFAGNSPALERLPECVVCGFHDQLGGTLDPGRYVQGLAQTAQSLGARIYEHTAAQTIETKGSIRITTPSGLLESDLCVLGTNAYTPNLGYLSSRLMPISVSVIVTEPLSDLQLGRLNWVSPRGMYTAHHILENLRLTPDNRLLVGTKHIRPGFGRRLPSAPQARAFEKLEMVLRDRFPQLHEVEINCGWTGTVAATTDFVPIIGRTGRDQNVFYAAGYSGHGIAMASHAGEILGGLIDGEDIGDATVLMNRRTGSFPPEPLRWLGASARFQQMRLADARVDSQARARTSNREVA